MLIDSHAHLGSLDDIDNAIKNALRSGVDLILNMSSDYSSALQTVELTRQYPNVYGAVGIHPHEALSYSEESFSLIEDLSSEIKIVAIGETGLDYYYDNSPREIQMISLQRHIDLSIKSGKPIVIHMRDSAEDLRRMIGENCCPQLTGVIHCYTGDYETAMYFIDRNFYISFSGILTFNRSAELREVAKKLPKDKIVIETDSPYLAPVPFRGKKNQPAYVKYVAETLSQIRGEQYEQVAHYLTENTRRLFNLP